jgi:hypothetical protein
MKDVYVHTLRYRYGRGNRASRTMLPVSYGPFPDQDAAWEWVRQTGITHATRLRGVPANENIEIPDKFLSAKKEHEFSGFLSLPVQQNSVLSGSPDHV